MRGDVSSAKTPRLTTPGVTEWRVGRAPAAGRVVHDGGTRNTVMRDDSLLRLLGFASGGGLRLERGEGEVVDFLLQGVSQVNEVH